MGDNSGGKSGVPPDLGISALGSVVASSMHILNGNGDVGYLQQSAAGIGYMGNSNSDEVSEEEMRMQTEDGANNSSSDSQHQNGAAINKGLENADERVSQANANKDGDSQSQKKPNNTDDNARKNRRQVFLYASTDSAPFNVYIENTSADFTGGLNPIKVGGIILTAHPEIDNKIIRISSIGRNRIKVEFSDYIAANRLVRSIQLFKHSLEAYIPKFHIYRKGVVRGVSQDLSEGYLKCNIKPCEHNSFTVDEVKRITRKTGKIGEDGEEIRQPTQSIIVSFKSSTLPKYIIINKVRCEVECYVQRVLICYRCYRYGHIGKQCKASPRCIKCGENHASDSCDMSIKCLHCGGGHYATQLSECPEFQRQKRIKNTMSVNNMSYSEAAKSIPKKTYALVTQGNKDIYRDNRSRSPQSLPQNVQTPSKRIRSPSLEDEIAQQHKKIVAQYTIPNKPGGILSQSSHGSPRAASSGGNKDDLDEVKQFIFTNVLEVVKRIVNTMKQSNNFEINFSDMHNLIANQLSSSLHKTS